MRKKHINNERPGSGEREGGGVGGGVECGGKRVAVGGLVGLVGQPLLGKQVRRTPVMSECEESSVLLFFSLPDKCQTAHLCCPVALHCSGKVTQSGREKADENLFGLCSLNRMDRVQVKIYATLECTQQKAFLIFFFFYPN